MSQQTAPSPSQVQPGLNGIKNIVAIASGKGGVGKSTIAVNLAMALKSTGASVGLLDADIYGPSQPGMLGAGSKQPEIGDNYLEPLNQQGIKFVSMGLLTGDDSPVIWRAPMAMKMIHQFLGAVKWGELDYLLVDLPPGTGDVQLTLAQQARLSGAVIVTTPQEVALGVARKGLRMFGQVNVPILGVIENMSGFTCKHCGEETAIFDKGGGSKMAEEFNVPFLGALPLDPEIMMSGESGAPLLSNASASPTARAVLEISDRLKESIEKQREATSGEIPEKYEVGSDGNLHVSWVDSHKGMHTPYMLRINCPCASCVDEDSGKPILNPQQVPLDIKIKNVASIGNYGIAIEFSDGHSTGIYKFVVLRATCECDKCTGESESQQQTFSV